MAQIEETRLPGVGLRHDFVTRAGRRVGVIAHRTGHRELLVYARDDPDACTEVVDLDEADSSALVEILGGSQVSASVADLRQSVEGLAIDWVPIRPDWSAAGYTIGDTQLRRRTGVSIVALLRDGTTIPSPEPSQDLCAGDTAVVVGTPGGISNAVVLLQSG